MKASLLHFLAVSAFALADTLEKRQSDWIVGQTVQTDSGPVSGHPALNASQVSEYLGIPFAVPPVGDLRFAPPQKYSGSSPINGTSFVSQRLSSENISDTMAESKSRDFLAPPPLFRQMYRHQISQMPTSQLQDS
jgi:hypothetical protein